MKIVVVLIALLGVVPLALLIHRSRRVAGLAWIGIGFLPFLLPAVQQVDIALANYEGWLGYVHGIEITVIDFLALALLLVLPKQRRVLNFHVPLAFYLFALVLASFQAAQPLPAYFNIVQFARIYLLIVVVTRGCVQEGVPLLLLKGLALGLGLQLVVVIHQLAGGSVVQPPGTFVHQNTLGMVVHLVALPHFALLLAGARGLQFMIIPPVALLIASLTASRATLGLCVLGFAATYLLSLLRRLTARKIFIGALGVLGLLMLTPIMLSSFERRFADAPLAEDVYDERAAFNRTARMVLSDYPMGVGPNHYVYVAKNFGYAVQAGVAPFENNLSNIVHNVYLLAAAETGYIGLAAVLFLLGYPLVVSAWFSVVSGPMRAGDLLLGLSVSIAIISLHSIYEYILFLKEVQYIFAIAVGTIFGVATRVALLNGSPVQMTVNRAGFSWR